MFTVLMALAMAVLDKPTKRAESYEAPIPLMQGKRITPGVLSNLDIDHLETLQMHGNEADLNEIGAVLSQARW